jgi:uncharacterized membrane protein|tara:strand:- start:2556 stop:2789 length:234 start_codon:yes stop_codon:yes gene_type:complete
MTFTPNFIGAMGSLLILGIAFFMGTNGLAFAALSMLILAVVLVIWLVISIGIYCLAHRLATQLESVARLDLGADDES